MLGRVGSLVMVYDTTCGRFGAGVAGQVANDTANGGAINAAFSLHWSR
jgi:hypothetical protein